MGALESLKNRDGIRKIIGKYRKGLFRKKVKIKIRIVIMFNIPLNLKMLVKIL